MLQEQRGCQLLILTLRGKTWADISFLKNKKAKLAMAIFWREVQFFRFPCIYLAYKTSWIMCLCVEGIWWLLVSGELLCAVDAAVNDGCCPVMHTATMGYWERAVLHVAFLRQLRTIRVHEMPWHSRPCTPSSGYYESPHRCQMAHCAHMLLQVSECPFRLLAAKGAGLRNSRVKAIHARPIVPVSLGTTATCIDF